MFVRGIKACITIAACLASVAAIADENMTVASNAHITSPTESSSNLVYVSPHALGETIEFALPQGISEHDIARVRIANNLSGKPNWYVKADKIFISPLHKWSIGSNVIELELKNGKVNDYFVIIYAGKFQLTEKTDTYHQRQHQAKIFKQYISADHTNDASIPVILTNQAFLGKTLAQVRVNGITITNAQLQNAVFSYSPSSSWREGLNQIEIQLTNEDRRYLHLLSYHSKVAKVEYSMTASLVDGKPFFPRAIYAVKTDSFPKVADFGFNIVHNYQLRTLPEDGITAYLQAADKNGLMVFSHINENAVKDGDVLAFATRIANQMAEPALFAWYFWDEPSPNDMPSDYYTFFTDLTRKLDPYHPLISSHWYQRYYADAGEIDMRQLYQGKVARMASALTSYKRTMAQNNAPWLAILNTHEGFKPRESMSISPSANNAFVNKATSPEQKNIRQQWLQARYNVIASDLANPPFPIPSTLPQTRHQIRGQAFEAIAQGSNGIFYWLYSEPDQLHPVFGWYTLFHLPESAGHMRELMNDLKTLEPLIISPSQNSVSWMEKGIRIWLRQNDNNTIIIAVNETGKRVSRKISLSQWHANQLPDELVRFGHQSKDHIEVVSGHIADIWQPNQAHVYLLNAL